MTTVSIDVEATPREDMGSQVASDLGSQAASQRGSQVVSIVPSCTRSSRPAVASVSSHASASDKRLSHRPFGFESQSSYNASAELTRLRDINFRIRPTEEDDNIWRRPPPDFRPQCFEPKPPKRNSREAMRPWRYGPLGAEEQVIREARRQEARETMALPELMKPASAEVPNLKLTFHIMDADEARADFVTNGMYKPGPFSNPQPHDYRQYPPLKSLGLPKFDTSFDPDPYNIKFHSERLGIIHGLAGGVPPERNIKGRQMCPPLRQPPKWESRLTLPAGPWPTPVAQYSRFRPFWRSPQTVLLDRMEQTLTTKWAQEKQEAAEKAHRKLKESHQSLVQSENT